ncbi:hypothetical protein PoB_001442800 [Plakobranchus ocellatus]|uniref:Uncharacterized protein n=1 Tax=Plakobranchus ocellatus TaxID=259542 RepID=A0AAV3Z0A1_9GAST|nr:hypothetical protein PoB_001442800 [Plakobranchus ocellatus]
MVVLVMNIKFISIHRIHINTNDSDDGLFVPQTNDDTNDEGSHDWLLDDAQTNSDTNDEGTKHDADETYQMQVSWIGNDTAHPVAVYEYKGVCPNLQIHGRKTTGNTISAYVRLNPSACRKLNMVL